MSAPFTPLEEIARRVVEQIHGELPPDLAREAREIPCLFADYCPDDPEILGTYGSLEPGHLSETNGPIILYLEAIADFCEEEDTDFAEEIRITYLHELGHHFGWDEGDLEERGLE